MSRLNPEERLFIDGALVSAGWTDLRSTTHRSMRIPASAKSARTGLLHFESRSQITSRCHSGTATASGVATSLQPRIYRLALQREHAKHALVHAPEGLALHESFEPFDPQGELAQSQ
jgi:hypothetical protein